jgi:hypothetical protein
MHCINAVFACIDRVCRWWRRGRGAVKATRLAAELESAIGGFDNLDAATPAETLQFPNTPHEQSASTRTKRRVPSMSPDVTNLVSAALQDDDIAELAASYGFAASDLQDMLAAGGVPDALFADLADLGDDDGDLGDDDEPQNEQRAAVADAAGELVVRGHMVHFLDNSLIGFATTCGGSRDVYSVQFERRTWQEKLLKPTRVMLMGARTEVSHAVVGSVTIDRWSGRLKPCRPLQPMATTASGERRPPWSIGVTHAIALLLERGCDLR